MSIPHSWHRSIWISSVLLEKVDLTLEEGRELREKIVRAMYERRQSSGPHAISNRGKSESLSS